MTKNKKIYEKNSLYSLIRPYVDRCIRKCYRKIVVTGRENLPEDGAIILSPNHCNTLMDALVMLQAHKGETVFGARADLFNNPLIAKIMFFLRILPMVRQRDGLRNVLKNHQTQETIVETLENGVRFCIFPEGRHRPEKSLLPLGKGIFRAALAANEKFGKSKPVYIVPVGLEYGDFFRIRSTALISYGKAINVTEFVSQNPEFNDAQIMDALRKELHQRMSGLFSFINDGDNLQQKWTLTRMIYRARHSKGYGDFGTGLEECMRRNRAIISEIEESCKENPEKMQAVFEDIEVFEKKRRKDGISFYSFAPKRNPALNIIGKSFAAILGLPYFIFCAVTALPIWLPYFIIKSNIKDKAFYNTVGLGVKLGIGTLLIPIYTTLAFCTLPWEAAVLLLLAAVPSYSYFFDYLEGMRRFVSDIRIMKCKKLKKQFTDILEKGIN